MSFILAGAVLFWLGFVAGTGHHRCRRQDIKTHKQIADIRMMALGLQKTKEGSARHGDKTRNNRENIRRDIPEDNLPSLRGSDMVGSN